jgi:putative sigma-54 modulation protein
MNTIVIGRKISVDDSFKELVLKKLSRLEKLFGPDANARVVVGRSKDRETVEVTISYKGDIYRAEDTSLSKNESIDKVLKALARQMRKHKTRLAKRFKSGTLEDVLPASELGEIEDIPEYEIVKSKEFAVKPMSVDEAILELDLLGHPFFIFKDADTDAINVVYKRKDGRYGLLVPHS